MRRQRLAVCGHRPRSAASRIHKEGSHLIKLLRTVIFIGAVVFARVVTYPVCCAAMRTSPRLGGRLGRVLTRGARKLLGNLKRCEVQVEAPE
jgi:hypothetical protein